MRIEEFFDSLAESVKTDKNYLEKILGWDEIFDFKLDEGINTYRLIYKNETNDKAKKTIIKNFAEGLSFVKTRKEEVFKLFPYFEDFEKYRMKNYEYIQLAYQKKQSLAFKELQQYLEGKASQDEVIKND